MFPQCSIYYTSNTSIEEEHQVFFWSVVNFPENYQRYCAIPIIAHFYCQKLLDFRSFCGLRPLDLLRLCPGDLTAPPDPQLARAMTFACRHDITINPTNFWWWWFEGGGRGWSHEISQTERGDQQFFCCFLGGSKI